MTNQQKIGSAIIISVLILGIIFKFFNPIVAFIFLLAVACGIWAEAAKSQTPPTMEDIQRKYPKRKSQEQIKSEQLRRRQAEYDRDLANRMRDRGMSASKSQAPSSSASKRDISIAKFRQLTKMVNGQKDVARRLIEGNLKLFPDKSPDWACDKAIADLERDRRA